MFFALLLAIALLIPSQELVSGMFCDRNDECAEEECCAKIFFISKCKKLGQEGSFCTIHDENDVTRDFYHFFCPCGAGLNCVAEKTEENNGTIIHHNPKCTKEEPSEDF